MSTENHLGLPEEVFEMILCLLDTPDLLSCALVCSGWRNAVNSDLLWKRLCQWKIPPERQATVSPKVEERFSKDPPPLNLCRWRVQYAKDVMSKLLWKSGDFEREPGFAKRLGVSWPDGEVGVLEMTDEVVLELSRGSFAVFDLSVEPTEVEEPLILPKARHHYSLGSINPSLFKIINGVLVVVQGRLLQVYIKDAHNDFHVKLIALFDQNYARSRTIPLESNLLDWYRKCVGGPTDILVQCDHNGQYFVGGFPFPHPNGHALHIWDLEKLTKVGVVTPADPIPGHAIHDFALRKNVIHVIMVEESMLSGRMQDGPGVIRSYDIDTQKFWHSGVQVGIGYDKCHGTLFTDDLLITDIPCRREISFHHFKTQNLSPPPILYNMPGDSDGYPSIIIEAWTAVDNILAFVICDGRERHVNVYDMVDCRYLDEFYSPPALLPTLTACTEKIYIIFKDLVLLATSHNYLLRDVKKKMPLWIQEFARLIAMSPSYSKILVFDPVCEDYVIL